MNDIELVDLETINGVSFLAASTNVPWELSTEAIVVSVGPSGPGQLGGALQDILGEKFSDRVDIGAIVPAEPLWYPLTATSSVMELRGLVLASARDPDERTSSSTPLEAPATPAAAALGVSQAVALAAQHNVRRLATPLLGTGGIGLRRGDVALATFPRLRMAAITGELKGLERIVIFGPDPTAASDIEKAWRGVMASAEPPKVTASDSPKPSSEEPHWPDRLERWVGVELSDTASVVLARAAAVAEAGSNRRTVRGEHVWFAALEHAERSARPDVASGILRLLGPDSAERVQRLSTLFGGGRAKSRSDRSPDEFPNLRGIVGAATEISERVTTQRVVRQRFLLAAATRQESFSAEFRNAIGADDETLRHYLHQSVMASLPGENPAVWDELLIPQTQSGGSSARPTDPDQPAASSRSEVGASGPAADESDSVDELSVLLAGGISRDLVSPGTGIPSSEDSLGLEVYVDMFANLITLSGTPMPLSIGLFGEWGSGKSTFMGLLNARIQELSDSGTAGYLGHVKPISFNAWHYADTNLWASLGDEIFEQLAGPTAKPDAQREKLRHELDEKLNRRRELEDATTEAQHATAALQTKIAGAREEAATSARTLLGAIAGSDFLKKQAADIWKRLGVNDEVAQSLLLADEVRGAGRETNAVRTAMTGLSGKWMATVSAIALLLIVAGVALAGPLPNALLSGGLLGVVGSVAAFGTLLVARARSGVTMLGRLVADIRTSRDRQVEAAVRDDLERLTRAQADEKVLDTQLTEVLARAGEIGRELADLAPGQRFYGFIAERVASGDYRRELSLVSIIRHDFEKLVELMNDWRKPGAELAAATESDGTADGGPGDPDAPQHPRIDRIVLYIDDLDRCSPKQVVDVLQAVHLLLALDLFVVVVGVDPRWLLHSLDQQYRDNFVDRAAASLPAGAPSAMSPGWTTSPLDYLEKIFNIPFVLPGMTKTSFGKLIDALANEKPHDEGSPVKSAASVPEVRTPDTRIALAPDQAAEASASTLGEPGDPAVETVTVDLGADEGSAAPVERPAAAPPPPTPLRKDERELLGALAPLVGTPRGAKRLMNLYRTLRSTSAFSGPGEFLGTPARPGEYQAVAVMLGLLEADAELVGQLLWAPPDGDFIGGICHRGSVGTWPVLLESLTPVEADGVWTNCLGTLEDQARIRWTLRTGQLRTSCALVTLSDLQAFQKWGPIVARFSFTLSPLAGGVAGRADHAESTPTERPAVPGAADVAR